MGKLKKIISIAAILGCCSVCFAKQINIQIVQHDESSSEVSELSYVIEDSVLNGLFDDGYIVTNSPAEVSASVGQDEDLLKKGLGDSFNGFSDYFIQIKLFYTTEESVLKPVANLKKIDWVLASAKTGTEIQHNSITNKSTKKDDLTLVSSNLLAEIKKAIKA